MACYVGQVPAPAEGFGLQPRTLFYRGPKKMLCSYFCNIRKIQYDQKSPVNPVSKSMEGPLSVTQQQQQEQDSTSPF